MRPGQNWPGRQRGDRWRETPDEPGGEPSGDGWREPVDDRWAERSAGSWREPAIDPQWQEPPADLWREPVGESTGNRWHDVDTGSHHRVDVETSGRRGGLDPDTGGAVPVSGGAGTRSGGRRRAPERGPLDPLSAGGTTDAGAPRGHREATLDPLDALFDDAPPRRGRPGDRPVSGQPISGQPVSAQPVAGRRPAARSRTSAGSAPSPQPASGQAEGPAMRPVYPLRYQSLTDTGSLRIIDPQGGPPDEAGHAAGRRDTEPDARRDSGLRPVGARRADRPARGGWGRNGATATIQPAALRPATIAATTEPATIEPAAAPAATAYADPEPAYAEPTRADTGTRRRAARERPASTNQPTVALSGGEATTGGFAALARDGRTGGRRFPGHQAFLLGWALGLVVPVVLWWQHTAPLDGTPAVLTAAGRLTGLIAGYALLSQLVLTSRLPELHRIAGADRLLRWHRDIGALTLISTLAHAVLLTKGYAYFEQLSLVGQAWKFIDTTEDMLNAFGATAMMVAVGVLSIRALRRRLSYEVWHAVHRSAYLVLLLGYGHQFALGSDVSLGFGRYYWAALHIGVVAAVVWGRVLAPLLLNWRHQVRVADIVDEGPGVVSIYLSGRYLAALDAHAGQYLRWRFLDGRCWWRSHPFSLSAPPNDEWLRITVKAVGDHTSLLADLRPGTRVWISEPAGGHTGAARATDQALLIAAGSGIAPARALLPEMPPGTVLVYRASTPDDLVFRAELEDVARARGAKLYFITGSRDEPGPRRLLTAHGLEELVPDITRRDVYLCGPPGFALPMAALLNELRVPRRQQHVHAFEL